MIDKKHMWQNSFSLCHKILFEIAKATYAWNRLVALSGDHVSSLS